MIVTVMKIELPKNKPIIRQYRDFRHFDLNVFSRQLSERLHSSENMNYTAFQNTFLELLDSTAAIKKKTVRANDKPWMSQALKKAIMRRSFLKNKYYKSPSAERLRELKTHQNYTSRLAKRTKKGYFSQIDIRKISDNKKFWQTIGPLFSHKWNERQNIVLLEKNKIVSEDSDIARVFSSYFKTAVDSLKMPNIDWIFSDTTDLIDPIEIAVKKFELHPSILEIKKHFQIEEEFSFSFIQVWQMNREIGHLKLNKATPIQNIPIKTLKDSKDVVSLPLTHIFNTELVTKCHFPDELKLADISPLHKKMEKVFVQNFRPVSLLPVVSKLFERLMHSQIEDFVSDKLSKYLCGYRKGYNTQYALLLII